MRTIQSTFLHARSENRVGVCYIVIAFSLAYFAAFTASAQGGGSISGSPWQGCSSSTNGSYTFTFSESQAGGYLCSQPSWTLNPGSAGNLNPNNMSATVTWNNSGYLRVDYCVFVYSTQQVESRYVQQYFQKLTSPNAGTVSASSTLICTGQNVTLSVSGNNATPTWQKCTSGAGCGTSNDTGWSTTTTTQSSMTTTTKFRTKISTMCGTSYSNVVTVTVSQPPTPANAGTDQTGSATCGLTSLTLGANAPSVGTGSWSVISGSGGSLGNSSSPSSSFNGVAGSTYTLRWTISNSPCAASYDDVIIKFNANPIAHAGLDKTSASTCGQTSVTLGAISPPHGSGSWSIVSGGGGSFGNISSSSSTFNGTAGSTYVLRWSVTNSPCGTATDDVTVKFNLNPTTASAGPDQTTAATCGLTTIALAGNAPSVGTGLWSVVSGSGGSFGSASNPSSSFSGTAGTTYTLRWTISNSPCTSSYDDVVVKFNRNPTTANAGLDQTGSSTCGLTSVTLAGNAPSVGTGIWTKISGAGGSFGNASSPTSSFSGTPGSTYTLRWTISNSPCTSSYDDVVVKFNLNPTTANAGADQTGSSTCGLTSVTLGGNAPSVGTGSWSIVSGSGGAFGNASSPSSSFSGTAGTTYTLRWTISNSPCTSSYDDVVVKFNRNPTTANAGLDQTGSSTCGLTSVTLAGNAPSVGTGIWTKISGTGGSFGNASSPTSTFTGNIGSSYVLRWTISNSPCVTSTDDMAVTFHALSNGGTLTPSVQVYGPATGQLTLTGYTGAIERWESKEGTGSWTNIANTTSSHSYSVTNKTVAYRVLLQNSVCAAVYSNEATISSYPVPSLTIVGPNYLSPGGSTKLVTDQGFDSYEWYKDGGSITPLTPTELTVTHPGTYRLTVRATASAPPYSPSDIIIGNAISDQPTPINYIVTSSFLKQGVTLDTDLYSLTSPDLTQAIEYFDGLGRPIQTVTVGSSPNAKDVVLPIVYDAFGREELKYLSYARDVHNGSYVPGALAEQAQFYNYEANIDNDAYPFAKTVFEPSPLNRVLKQGAVGEFWQPDSDPSPTTDDHSIKYSHETNAANEVLLWTYTAPNASFPLGLVNASTGTTPNYFMPNQLFVTRTRDEDQHEVIEYKDKQGKVILRTVQAPAGGWAKTYFVYDDFDNVVIVIPPEATARLATEYFNESDNAIKDTFLKTWAFRYRYDERKRITIKQVPGAEPMYLIYDPRDRLVLTQDGVQRSNTGTNEWIFTKYDQFNRVVLTGKYLNDNNSETMQTTVNNYYNVIDPGEEWHESYQGSGGTILGYTNKSFPQVATEVSYHMVTYYDLYDSYMAPSGYAYVSESLPDQEGAHITRVAGQISGQLIKNLTSGAWMRTVNYYDDRYRLIQSTADHHLGTVRTTNVYDFPGRTKVSKKTYVVNTATTTVMDTYAYDHLGRVTEVRQSINGSADVIILRNEYNELGALIDKKLHSVDGGNTFKQSVDQRYNIRGWLTNINDPDIGSLAPGDPAYDYFGMQIAYNDQLAGFSSPQLYNGIISAIQWSKGNGGPVDLQAYTFKYDPMNRLQEGKYYHDAGAGWSGSQRAFQEKIHEYDLNGNISKLSRRGFAGVLMDSLLYSYNGNKLSYVHDYGLQAEGFVNGNTGTDDYDYDQNGNLDKDKNKGLATKGTIKYNHLNLPIEVIKGAETIKYIYDAGGRKLRQEVYTNNGTTLVNYTDYIQQLVYEGGELKFIQHVEGRVVPSGGSWEYQYHLTDHLGNIRVTFTTKQQPTSCYVANMENGHSNSGDGIFGNYTSTPYDLVDHTDTGTTYQRVQLLNGGASGRIGLTKSLSVMPGDRVAVTAYAKYRNLTANSNTNVFATALTSAFGVSAGSTGEQLKLYNTLDAYGVSVAGGNHSGDDDAAPKAFVTILLFDRDFNFLDAAWDQVTTNDEQISATTKEPFDYPLSKEVVVREAGYAYIFLSNEHPTFVDVYYDDVSVCHTPSPIVSSNDYYPFGLTFNSFQRENGLEQRQLYNGKELQDELGLGWLDYGARMYMPDLGRWKTPDPLGENSFSMTPYHYAGNSPISFFDPNGLDWFYYKEEGDEQARWHWQDGNEYEHTYNYTDEEGKEQTQTVKLQGYQAVVVFDGSEGERLGKGDNLYGEGSKLAKVTVYGPGGQDDVQEYEGYTLSSDPSEYGQVASNSKDWLSDNAFYIGKIQQKSSGLPSYWLIDQDGVVPATNGYNPSNSSAVVTGAFIHRSNQNGSMFWSQNIYETYMYYPEVCGQFGGPVFAQRVSYSVRRGVSEGCLIIAPGRNRDNADWDRFTAQMGDGKKLTFAVQVLRK